MDITHLPLASDSYEGLIKLVAIVGIMIVIGVIKAVTKAREAAEEIRRRERQRELEQQTGQRPSSQPPVPPVQRPMPTGGPPPNPNRNENIYYPPASQTPSPPLPSRPAPSSPRDFGGAVLTPSTTSRPMPVPVPKRPAPAPQRPGQQPPRQAQAGPATVSGEASQALQLLKQVDQQIGVVEGNLAKLQARRNQLSALAGVRTRSTATVAVGTTASPLHLNMRDRTNVRQGIIVSELLRPPVGLREEEGSWAK